MSNMALKYNLQKKAKMMARGGRVMCAEGGEACPGCPSCSPDESADRSASVSGGYADGGLVERIMRKRHGETERAGEQSADFDYLDQIEPEHDADYTAENSGDMEGNEALEDDERDIVKRIMRSRSKKDHNPRPA